MAIKIVMSGYVGWEITADSVRAALAAAKGDDVIFHASGPGGLVYEGIEIYNVIREYSGRTEMIITGIAASMMSYIALSVDKVMAYDNATFMIHNPWDFTAGDYNVMQESSDYLRGLSGLMSKAYIKKTGKSAANMKAIMDKDSFFFGDEILSEGFVDEILEAPDDLDNGDKATAIISAQASIKSCMNKMRDSEAANTDRGRAVAYFDSMSLLNDPLTKPTPPVAAKGVAIKPAVAGTNKEDKYMSLEALLADNPAARVEHDAAIVKATADGKAAAKSTMDAVIAKVSPQLTSPDYGADVKDAGIKAITGEGHISTFDTLVIMADRDNEAAAAAAAEAESNAIDETPGAAAGAGDDATAAFKQKKADIASQGGF